MTAATDSLPPGFLADLAEYVAIPSDSRSAPMATMRAAAEWLAARLDWAGGRVEETDGFPVVRADWLGAPGAPTVLVYGHYDVQPTGDLTEWHTAPFELVVDGDVLRGRGVTDDKGPVLLVLEMARTMLAERGALPLNVRFLLEGEEEIGSPHLPAYVRAHAAELAADLVISADGAMWRPTEPSISIASKGLVALDVVVTGAAEDLHSGRYGGTVANPVHALATVLASLHTADGAVAVAGFTDGVDKLPPQRRAEIDAVDFDDEEYRAAVGAPELFGEAGYSTLARLWERPTLEVNGITAGGKYTVIPHRAVGHVSCRLVGRQDPDRVVEAISAHVAALDLPGVRVEVRADPGRVPAYRIEPDHPAVRAAREALAEVYPGQEVLLAVIAGTLPATTLFESALGAKTLFFSFATADEKHHAPNEFLRIARIGEGMRAWAALWDRLATGGTR
ncbi:putative peptidase M20 [Modestobacter italicus]|uniref:Peptidase M20 n=1 Tax=Modestobacter italicus (strain DSM 44449 / CECT 9708 / BC 501) TaxID=2732864 RepID=I4F1A2_MODI5|nr:M20/M25/M40 family metallo-hydrolase [Modestobacter marinus]CCH89415.1 putative peptidase M20 [Modestobacter marinus]